MAAYSEMNVEQLRAMLGVLYENNPDGVTIVDAAGTLITNPAGQRMLPMAEPAPADTPIDDWSDKMGLFMPDGKTRHPVETLPLVRSLRNGETVRDYELLFINRAIPDGRWLSFNTAPIGKGHAISIYRDVTERKKLEKNLAERNSRIELQMRENQELIERLRMSVEELSTPVLELWDDVICLPVIGVVDTVRSARMTEKALTEVVARRCRFVIVDITGVDIVDTSTADRLLRLSRAVELLGASCVISGIQPAVAQTLTTIGVDFEGLVTHRNLKRAIEYCILQKQREGIRAG